MENFRSTLSLSLDDEALQSRHPPHTGTALRYKRQKKIEYVKIFLFARKKMTDEFLTFGSDDEEHTSPPSTEHHPASDDSNRPKNGIFVAVEHVALLVGFVVLMIYLGGASERGMMKVLNSIALRKNNKMQNAFVYSFSQFINACTMGILGLVLNVSQADPFEGVPVARVDGKLAPAAA